jgi:MFS family permease
MVILEQQYGKGEVNKGYISSAVLIGAVFGQLTFGYLADKIGRRKGFIATLTLVILG